MKNILLGALLLISSIGFGQCLIADFPFESDANDISGNGNNGTVNGATPTCDRFGRADSSYVFNGTTDYIEIQSNSNLQFDNNQQTVSFWLYVSQLPTPVFEHAIIEKMDQNLGVDITGNSAEGFKLRFIPNSNIEYSMKSGNTSSWGGAAIPSSNINLNNYTHIVFSVDGDSIKGYVNGEKIVSSLIPPGTTIGVNSSPLLLGKSLWTSNGASMDYLNGKLDDVKIFNCALSAQQIDSIYQAEKSPLDPCLVAKYDFNGNANDLSGNCNHGTVNGATLTIDRYGNANSAYSFDGVNDYIQINNFSNDQFENDFSIKFWCSFNDFTNNYPHIIYGENNYFSLNGNGPAYTLDTSKVSVYQGPITPASSRRIPYFDTHTKLTPNLYYQLVFTKKDTVAYISVNGVIEDSINVDNSLSNPIGNYLQIGSGFNNTSDYCFSGILDDVTIFNCSLDSSQIDSIWKAECVPFETANNASICSYDSLLVGGGYQTTTGAYYDTLSAANGCDSIITTNLTVMPAVVINETANNLTCNGGTDGSISISPTGGLTNYSYAWNNLTTTSSISGLSASNYSITITDGMGCIANGSYTITEPIAITSTDNQTICEGDSIQVGGIYQSVANTYSITITASNGCDSLVDVTLSVNPTLSTTVTASICEGDSLLVGGTYQTITGNYNDTTASLITGCDSVITTSLSLNDSLSNTISGTIYFTGSPITSGEVKLIRKDGNSPQSMFNTDSMMVNSDGTYLFDSLSAGNYLVKALGDTSMYLNVATYGDSTNHWNKAIEYTVAIGCLDTVANANIYLVDFPTTIGFGNINGRLVRGGPQRAGEPILGADISLEQIPGEVIKGGGTTDDNGDFTLKNIEIGDYRLYVGMMGYEMDTLHVVSFDGTGLNYDVTICTYDTATNIDLCAKTLTIIAEIEAKEVFVMYPNPASNLVTIKYTGNDVYIVEVIDITGKTVLRKREQITSTVIDITKLSEGIYTVKLTGSDTEITQKLIIQK